MAMLNKRFFIVGLNERKYVHLQEHFSATRIAKMSEKLLRFVCLPLLQSTASTKCVLVMCKK